MTSFTTPQLVGNLALCSDIESSTSTCLGWESNTAVVQPLNTTPQEQPLNWRFEEGLLRFVGADGFASSLCLGPNTPSLSKDALAPYELVLQACPGMEAANDLLQQRQQQQQQQQQQPMENIFSRHASASATVKTAPLGFEARQHQVISQHHRDDDNHDHYQLQDRHMRFLIGGDGRIRSLAPVHDGDSKNDLVAEQPFCLTSSASSKAYLIPCFDHDDEIHVYEGGTVIQASPRSANQVFMGDQQLFAPSANSSFESFLLDWQNEEESIQDETDATSQQDAQQRTVQLAYQVGYKEDPKLHPSTNMDSFDEFVIRVGTWGWSKLQEDKNAPAVFESALNAQSGVRTYQLSSFDWDEKSNGGDNSSSSNGQTRLGAYLLGRSSSGTTPPGLLASTSFLVQSSNRESELQHTTLSPTQQQQQQQSSTTFHSINWPWAHLFFWGFMICFAILIKIHKICRPSSDKDNKNNANKNRRENSLRESHGTVDTSAAESSQEIKLARASLPQLQQPTEFIVHNHQKRRRSSRGSFSSRNNSRRSRTSVSMARCALKAQEQLRQQQRQYSPKSSSNHSTSYHSRNLSPGSGSNHSRRELFDWDEESHIVPRIDTTLSTVTTCELTERNYMEDGLEAILGESDIEESTVDELGDSYREKLYEEYDDDDIEAQEP